MEEKEGGMSNSAAAEGEGLPKMFKVARRIKSPNIASLVGGLGRKRGKGGATDGRTDGGRAESAGF